MLKILIIEDDIIDQLALTRLIKKNNLNCELMVAVEIQEAKKLMQDNLFDLVVCDLNLPDGKAFDLQELIKKQPFILLSGYLDPESAKLAKSYGAIQVLQKSSDLNQLTSVHSIIQKMLDKHDVAFETVNKKSLSNIYVFNIQKLMDTFDNDTSEVADILELFLNENPRKLKEMESALVSSDREVVKRLAHRIKSNCVMIGLNEAHNIAKEIEIECQSADINVLRKKIQLLKNSAESTYPQLLQALQKLK